MAIQINSGEVNERQQEILTSLEAMQFLRVSHPTLRALRRNGQIKYFSVGSKHLFRLVDLEEFCRRAVAAAA